MKPKWTLKTLRKIGLNEPALFDEHVSGENSFDATVDLKTGCVYTILRHGGFAVASEGWEVGTSMSNTMIGRRSPDGVVTWSEPPKGMTEQTASILLFLLRLCLADGVMVEETDVLFQMRREAGGPWPQDSFEVKVELGDKALYEDVYTGEVWLMMRDDENVPKLQTKTAVDAVEIEAETIGNGAALRLVASLNCGGSFHWIPWWSLSSVLDALDCEPVFYESATNHLSHIKEYL